MDSSVLQEPLQNEASSDRDSISDMNIADDPDSDDRMSVEPTDGIVIQMVDDGEDMDDPFQTGEIITEINLSIINSLVANRGRIHTTSGSSSDDDSESTMPDFASEGPDHTPVTGMRNESLDNTRPQVVSTTSDHHILRHGSGEQPVTALVATSASSTFQNRRYVYLYFRADFIGMDLDSLNCCIKITIDIDQDTPVLGVAV
jgi:hypothetical protein